MDVSVSYLRYGYWSRIKNIPETFRIGYTTFKEDVYDDDDGGYIRYLYSYHVSRN